MGDTSGCRAAEQGLKGRDGASCSLGRQHVGCRSPEVGQAPSKTLRTMTPNFLSPRMHFHRKNQVTLSFRLWFQKPPQEAGICGLGRKSACGAREPAQG